ncbi:glycosyltransferase family 59 protein [Zasmidium cellare ATCC 36951]|uniref:Dol-P-Glc:Glc(2)Man(9)GlcNAc(2)-PP-Dol alpha-1,2-glucosyltransferase n=1 Tax=Zasmidium cellare ATCC 36951 TaxID=1080233 RepID=A0A6A6C7B0_ZASCE|nr:glycosyltransferase family 59 protein [Zasmidium cellare ATCC 36951]KAF2161619.1 glycosyltransferase family 59 protein [Zasmidium cellare ATCC 36951]
MATALASLLAPLNLWFSAVNHAVKEPYLDEVFHVRQAQHYCNGNFEIWDPKITTPPGLYVLSYLFKPVLGCSITSLRGINAICTVALVVMLRATYSVRREANNEKGAVSGLLATHSSLNIVLFPPLFFFSALYYTDVASTLSVTIFYWYFIRTIPKKRATFIQGAIQVLLGLISLTFRQTNIFWVAVAPAALMLIVELDRGHRVVKESMYRKAAGFGDNIISVAKTSWKMEVIYDPPIRDAWFEDFFRTIVSIVACACKAATQPQRILDLISALAPYIVLIASFAAFIFCNGSVVLGDKSNHIATINLPQMLYLWPFITFFSWPLLLPHFALLPLTILSRIGELAHLEPLLIFRRRYFLPRLSLLLGFIALALLLVHFNTIVHPFLLADNRHFHFYISRRLLRPWWVRYAVTPLYILTAWACIETRGEPVPSPKAATGLNHAAKSQSTADTLGMTDSERRACLPDGKSSSTVSFTLVSLATTALSLCTAPLVEPRYCIIPFIIWRMHLPLYTVDEHAASGARSDSSKAKSGKGRTWKAFLEAYDWRVVAETVWFLVINAVTGYIFISWGFEWPQEPGVVQRFMW